MSLITQRDRLLASASIAVFPPGMMEILYHWYTDKAGGVGDYVIEYRINSRLKIPPLPEGYLAPALAALGIEGASL